MKNSEHPRRLGPLFYSCFTLAVLLISAFTVWQMWTSISWHYTTHRYIRDLTAPAPETRQFAIEQLKENHADFTSHLISMLSHEDQAMQLFACEQLEAVRPLEPSALLPLTKLLTSTDATLRYRAAHAIAAYASIELPVEDEEKTIQCLCVTLEDHSSELREVAAYALGQFGVRSPKAASALHAVLEDRDLSVRLRAAWSLYEIDEDNLPFMIPIIEAALSESDSAARSFATNIIDTLGPVAKDAMPELVKQVNRSAKKNN